MTPCQLIAVNLRRLRVERGWDQRETAARLGGKWTPWGVSAAERSADGKKVKKFDADEITVIAEVFGVAVGSLFAPRVPCPECDGGGTLKTRFCPKCGARVVGEPAGGAR